MPPLNLYARVRFFPTHFAHETAGAARIRLSLRPLIGDGKLQQTSGECAARSRSRVREAVIAPGDDDEFDAPT